jgi:hypothetical protein
MTNGAIQPPANVDTTLGGVRPLDSLGRNICSMATGAGQIRYRPLACPPAWSWWSAPAAFRAALALIDLSGQ